MNFNSGLRKYSVRVMVTTSVWKEPLIFLRDWSRSFGASVAFSLWIKFHFDQNFAESLRLHAESSCVHMHAMVGECLFLFSSPSCSHFFPSFVYSAEGHRLPNLQSWSFDLFKSLLWSVDLWWTLCSSCWGATSCFGPLSFVLKLTLHQKKKKIKTVGYNQGESRKRRIKLWFDCLAQLRRCFRSHTVRRLRRRRWGSGGAKEQRHIVVACQLALPSF